jgi:hypothetical protein
VVLLILGFQTPKMRTFTTAIPKDPAEAKWKRKLNRMKTRLPAFIAADGKDPANWRHGDQIRSGREIELDVRRSRWFGIGSTRGSRLGAAFTQPVAQRFYGLALGNREGDLAFEGF